MTVSKNDLVYNYAVMRCKESQFLALDPSDIITYRKRDFQIDVLVANGKEAQRKYKGAVVDHVSVDEIMLLLVKGGGRASIACQTGKNQIITQGCDRVVSCVTALGEPRLQIFLISTGCIVKHRILRSPCFRMKWESSTKSEKTCPSPEATAAPTTPI